MVLLTPRQAASIASGVYALRTLTVAQLRENRQTLGCEGLFAADEALRFEGRSGALAWKKLSGFGYIAEGEGPFQGDVLVATRGTQGDKNGPDWISNYHIAMQLGPGGLPVHAGFHEIWKTFAADIDQYLRQRDRPPRRLHCVGHSLGGALATLTADRVSRDKRCEVALYTFGAPRIGDATFARSLTRRLGADRVQRVFHPSDPVPMIPLFPFFHAPFGSTGLQVDNALGGLINADAHAMEDSYLAAVGNAGWADLRRASALRADQAAEVQGWLERAAQGSNSFVMGSARLLSMIGRALGWLMLKAGKIVMGSVGVVLTAGATVLDQIAWLLMQAAQLSREIDVFTHALIKAIFGFLGRRLAQSVDITTAFLRWVLELLFGSLRAMAERALAVIR